MPRRIILNAIMLACLIVAIAPVDASGPMSANRWEPIGPEGGHITTLVNDPQNPQIIYAGTYGGGVFKSADGGANWQAAGAELAGVKVNGIAVDPQKPANVYVATVDNGVFKSTDGGAHWTTINTGLTILNVIAVAIDPQTPTTVYAGAEQKGVFKSVDGGTHWNASNTGLTIGAWGLTVQLLVINPQTPSTLYGLSTGGIIKSTDGAAHWSQANTGLHGCDALAMDPQNPNILYCTLDFIRNKVHCMHAQIRTDQKESAPVSGPHGTDSQGVPAAVTSLWSGL